MSLGDKFTATLQFFFSQTSVFCIYVYTCGVCVYIYICCVYICMYLCVYYTSTSISFPITLKSTATETSIVDLSIPLSFQYSPLKLLLGHCLISDWESMKASKRGSLGSLCTCLIKATFQRGSHFSDKICYRWWSNLTLDYFTVNIVVLWI